jgi:thioredoxin 1
MSKISDLTAGDAPVLVEFFAAWCPHCQRMMPRIEELKQRMGKKLKVVQLDVDSPANQDAVQHFGIDSYPTFILFSHGKQTWRDSGERTVEDLMGIIDGHI